MSAGTDNQPYADNEQRQRQPLSHRSADGEEADIGVGLAEYFKLPVLSHNRREIHPTAGPDFRTNLVA